MEWLQDAHCGIPDPSQGASVPHTEREKQEACMQGRRRLSVPQHQPLHAIFVLFRFAAAVAVVPTFFFVVSSV